VGIKWLAHWASHLRTTGYHQSTVSRNFTSSPT